MSASIKPEIFISWIPTGKINLQPLIFASFIPAPEKANANLLRKVSTSESTHADLARQIKNNETSSADLLRNVIDSENFSADTKRKLFSEENISSDTFRKIIHAGGVHADTFREVKSSEKIIADTSRKIGITATRSNLYRIVKVTENSIGDLRRKVGGSESFSADIFLKIVNSDKAHADSLRHVKDSESARADTLIKNALSEKISSDIKRTIANLEKNSADTYRKLSSTEKFSADLLRGLRDKAYADTFRKVYRSAKTVADTVIHVPHILKYVVQPRPRTLTKKPLLRDTPSLINTFKDYKVTAINITLAERTLSDTFTVELVDDNINIGDTVSIYLLDYPFEFRVEEITYRDSVKNVKGIYSVDEQLYTWFQMPYGNDGDKETKDYYPTAIAALQEIAADLGLTADIRIENFTPTNLQAGEFVTYSDVINSLFSWSSSVASRQINVFIRGKTLYAIERGHEGKNIDITDLPHSRPTVNQKFNRVLCHNPNKDDTDTDTDNDDKPKFSGTVSYQQIGVAPFNARFYVSLTYSSGLLTDEHLTMQTGMFESDGALITRSQITVTKYQYITNTIILYPQGKFDSIESYLAALSKTKSETQYYLSSKYVTNETKEQNMTSKEITSNETETDTIYNYEILGHGEALYLFHEAESSTTTTKDGDDTEITRTTRDTYHFPAGNGFYAQAVYQNGILQGANISQGAPSNRVSPYTVDQMQKNFQDAKITAQEQDDDDFNDQLSAIVNYSFPIKEKTIKDKLNEELRWLHHKITETVTLDLISKIVNGVPEIEHIVDFTDRIIFNDNEYFLVSNHISFTPRKLIQTLQLIRWF